MASLAKQSVARNVGVGPSTCRRYIPSLRRSYANEATPSSKYTSGSESSSERAPSNSSFDPWRTLIARAPPQDVNPQEDSATHGEMQGWTVSVKDNFCTKDMPMTCSSRMLDGYRPTFDASVVSDLRKAGAHIIGKSQLDEFAMGSANVHTYFEIPINPAGRPGQELRAAGGSSGGAAASVAGGMCRVAIGSDTGGSVRLPASYCGVWGLKPSYGMVSRWGLVPYADSLDTVGIVAHNWADCWTTLRVLESHDGRDPTSTAQATRKRAKQAADSALERLQGIGQGSLQGLRIGIPSDMFPAELNSQVLAPFDAVVQFLASRGAEVVSVRLPNASLALSAYYVIASAEASSNLARYDGLRYGYRHQEEHSVSSSSSQYSATRTHGFGSAVRSRILLGTHALSSDAYNNTFLRAQRIRKVIQDDFDDVFRIPNILRSADIPSSSSDSKGVDVILHPCSVNTAPTIQQAKEESSEEEYVQDILTVPSSLAGIPAVSMPSGYAQDGWPVGTMAISQWGMERVLGVVGEVMREFELHNAPPSGTRTLLRPDFEKGLYAGELA